MAPLINGPLSSGFVNNKGTDLNARIDCVSAQSDQRLCYSLIGKYHI